MDKRRIFTYFLVGFSITVLIIGTALIIIGSILLNESKSCSNNNDNSFSTPYYLSTTTSINSDNSTYPQGAVFNYFIRIKIKLTNANNFFSKYDIQSEGQEIISKVRKALSSLSSPEILNVLSIDNDCESNFINEYNVIILLTYLNESPLMNDVTSLLTSSNIIVLETKNLVNNYIPHSSKDGSCTSFCDVNCFRTTTLSPITTTMNVFPITTTINGSLIATTTNVFPITTTINGSPITTTTNVFPITTTINGSPITTTTNVFPIITTTNIFPITTTTDQNPITLPSCSTVLAVDSSSDILNQELFQNELQVVQNFSLVMANFSNVLVTSYNNVTTIVRDFYSMSNENDFINAIGGITRAPGSRLSDLLLTLLNSLKNRKNEFINTVVLITEKVSSEILKSSLPVKLLKAMGSISFIIIGTDVKIEDLLPLNATNIYIYDFAVCNENELNNKFKNFTTCPYSPYFYNNFQTPTMYPCKSSITFSIDGSLILDKDKFEAQINGLTSDDVITDEWNNFERISLVKYYTSADIIVNFNYAKTRETFFEMVKMTQQTGMSVNLANLLAALESGLLFYPRNEIQNHFIFLSNDTTFKDIVFSMPYAKTIRNNGYLNFIVLGTDLMPGLNALTDDDRILYWDYKTTNTNQILKNFIINKITCI